MLFLTSFVVGDNNLTCILCSFYEVRLDGLLTFEETTFRAGVRKIRNKQAKK